MPCWLDSGPDRVALLLLMANLLQGYLTHGVTQKGVPNSNYKGTSLTEQVEEAPGGVKRMASAPEQGGPTVVYVPFWLGSEPDGLVCGC